jgi:hypothetical protein
VLDDIGVDGQIVALDDRSVSSAEFDKWISVWKRLITLTKPSHPDEHAVKGGARKKTATAVAAMLIPYRMRRKIVDEASAIWPIAATMLFPNGRASDPSWP